jgi:hypothetical protein
MQFETAPKGHLRCGAEELVCRRENDFCISAVHRGRVSSVAAGPFGEAPWPQSSVPVPEAWSRCHAWNRARRPDHWVEVNKRENSVSYPLPDAAVPGASPRVVCAERIIAIPAYCSSARRRSTPTEKARRTTRRQTRRWVVDTLPIGVLVVARSKTGLNGGRSARSNRGSAGPRR